MLAFISEWLLLLRAGLVLARRGVLIPAQMRNQLPLLIRAFIFLLSGGRRPNGKELAAALERLGPAYIKFGQFAATRPDIIGIRMAQELSRLKDDLAPFPVSQAEQTLQSEFGSEAKHLFPVLEPAIAAASVAQVHKVTTADGPVALKILRPRIETIIERELRAMLRGARALERFFPASRRLEPVAFINTVGASMRKEMNMRMEAASADEFADIAAHDNFFYVPAIDWSKTSNRVLALEWLDGDSMTNIDQFDNRQELANSLTRGFLASALDHGVFHADMHEGNIIILPATAARSGKARLALVDFGIMGRIDRPQRHFLAEILAGFLRRDYARVARVHFAAGYVPADRDIYEFSSALRAIGEPIFGRPAHEVSMGRVLIALFETTREFGMHLRPELVLLQKTMVQVEGVARSIDPEHDIWEAARPIVDRWIRREFGPEGVIRSTRSALKLGGEQLARLPGILDRLEQIADMASMSAPPRQSKKLLFRLALWSIIIASFGLGWFWTRLPI